jgi:hypothetical protein
MKKLGRWIGVAHDVGNPMTFWVLPNTCKVLARSTVWSLTDDEKADPLVQAQMANLDVSICEKIGDSVSKKEIDAALEDSSRMYLTMSSYNLEDELETAEPDSTMP